MSRANSHSAPEPPAWEYLEMAGATGSDSAGAAAAELVERLEHLAQVIAELGSAGSMPDVVEVVVSRAATATRAAVSTLMLREQDRLVLIGAHGLAEHTVREWKAFDIDDRTPASEAVRSGEPVLLAGGSDVESRYPLLRGLVPAGRSVLCLPLRDEEAPSGVIGLTFEYGWLPTPPELGFLMTFADTCAQAIRRIRAAEAAERRAGLLAFLADASAELSRSLDYRATLANVARLAVPRLADWCVVDIVHANAPVTLAVEHVDPAKVILAWELQRRYPTDPDALLGAPHVIRTGSSEIYPEITDEMLVAGAHDAEHLRLARGLGLRSGLVVPVLARGRTLGAITLVYAESGRRYTPADLAVAEDLGRRAGVAIDNALLYGRAQDAAVQLRRAVLPADLATIPGWEIATHSSSAGQDEVGGDFYDAIPLPDGRLAVYIGDVMGHGVAAAAAMAQMRAAVRAFLSINPDPASVMSRLDAMFERLPVAQLVSMLYALIDPATGELTQVSAGHYPPLLLDNNGTAQFAQTPPRRPLGVGGDERANATCQLAADTTVLLYTDGLVERRGETIDVGLARLAEQATILTVTPLAGSLSALADRLHQEHGDDDITAIAVRQKGWPLTPAAARHCDPPSS